MNKGNYFVKARDEIGDIHFIYMQANSREELYLLIETKYPLFQIISIGRIGTYKGYKRAIRKLNETISGNANE